MVYFVVRLDKSSSVNPYYSVVKERLEETGGNARLIEREDCNWLLYSNRREALPFLVIGLMVAAIMRAIIGDGFSWWYVMPLFIASAQLVYTRYFWYWVFKKGARKHGYVGTMELVSDEDVIEYFADGDAR